MEVRKHLYEGVLALMLATPMTGEARDYVTSLPGVADCLKKAVAGDRVIIEAGTYRDVDLKWKAVGTKQAPITGVSQWLSFSPLSSGVCWWQRFRTRLQFDSLCDRQL